ncbi:DUF2934 domain-containing protein [Paraburkholderia rhizosphaerae]|uniref:DUF2934 family protein n=1 Tax=Paraburkholderia rhizosphaerae TaxID=480658 RepID=A0A4R8LPP0_9BURK|nr:DUF2934 domain-containing protein [Paraburkholderia rhizosphaerae]TDY46534.1 Protein of unknown function (DUF2934) [Paraburkholderia rhizosphaerae]
MADEDSELRIRERAYHLWEQDGSPEGRADEYWDKARRQILAEGDDGPASVSADQSKKRQMEDAVPQDDAEQGIGKAATPRATRAR